MTDKIVIRIEDLVKEFPMKSKGFRGGKKTWFRALDHITANFPEGKRIGLIGMNGSGKSTLSNIIAGISQPTSGRVTVNGSVGILNTKIGMNAHLTGREAIHYKCLLLGFTDREIAAMEDDIIEFADIDQFIDQPVRTYSSGMRARLGFAISSQVKTDILVVDEALAVGDDGFASKCRDWMQSYCEAGNTVLFVSHSLSTMRSFCDEILWLHKGKQIGYGPAGMMLDAYSSYSKARKNMTKAEKKMIPTLEQWIQPSADRDPAGSPAEVKP